MFGGWSVWSQWSVCPTGCGTQGTQQRARLCNNPVPSASGGDCVGDSAESRNCPANNPCPGIFTFSVYFYTNGVFCLAVCTCHILSLSAVTIVMGSRLSLARSHELPFRFIFYYQ